MLLEVFMEGSCLCGAVSFRLSIEKLKICKCFCSLCQKQSGTESNLATIVAEQDFEFLSGEDSIKSWVKDSGFTANFCVHCGSPVPNRLRDKSYFWIPVGLLNVDVAAEVVSHIYTDSKRAVVDSPNKTEFSEFPHGGIEGHIEHICGKTAAAD